MKCLVVDPSPTMTRIIQNVLRAAGGEDMLAAPDREQALALCAEDMTPELDLLVTERDLPDGSGLELVSALRELEGFSQISVIMVSARNSRTDVLAAMEAGFDAYVLKPLNQEALLDRATAVLEARARRSEEDAQGGDEATDAAETEAGISDETETGSGGLSGEDEEERKAA